MRGRDGKEYLIPNETLITNQVINWSIRARSCASICRSASPMAAICGGAPAGDRGGQRDARVLNPRRRRSATSPNWRERDQFPAAVLDRRPGKRGHQYQEATFISRCGIALSSTGLSYRSRSATCASATCRRASCAQWRIRPRNSRPRSARRLISRALEPRRPQTQRVADHRDRGRLIAALAIIGLSSRPKTGYSTPAAIGTPSTL